MSGYRTLTPTPRRLRLCAGIRSGEVRWYHFRDPMAVWRGHAVTAEVRKLADTRPALATIPPKTPADAYVVVALTDDGERWHLEHADTETETAQPSGDRL